MNQRVEGERKTEIRPNGSNDDPKSNPLNGPEVAAMFSSENKTRAMPKAESESERAAERACKVAVKPSQFEPATGRDVAAVLDPCPITIIGAAGRSVVPASEGATTPNENAGEGNSAADEAGEGTSAPESSAIGLATVIWATPVSHQPAMTAFALRAKSHTMGLIRETGFFSLSTLPADEQGVRIAEFCGYSTGHRTEKAAEVACELIQPAEAPLALPVPEHALSWEICAVDSIQEAGDHLLVVGRVLQAASRASRDEKDRLAPAETLLCIQHGAYAPVGKTIPCN